MNVNSFTHKAIKNVGLTICKYVPFLRRLRKVYWKQQNKKYKQISSASFTEEHCVVFEAYGGRQFSCSPKSIYLALCEDSRFADWKLYWSFCEEEAERAKEIPELKRAHIITRGSEEYFEAFSRAKYWIQNNRVPEYITPRPDQIYVQCWHGTPLKRLGYDIPKAAKGGALNSVQELADRFNLDAQKWTYLISPSEYTSRCLCSAFGVPDEKKDEILLEEGYPRNDAVSLAIQSGETQRLTRLFKKKQGISDEKKLLLFAPTWRDDQFTEGLGYTLDHIADFDLLKKALSDNWVILLRTHYYIANKIDLSSYDGFVYNVSDVDDINDLYCIVDALCTDYSSVFFDYANTRRPLYFYWPDREHYEKDLHGFYLDTNALPGPKCETTSDLAQSLMEHDSWFAKHGDLYEHFCREYCSRDDGHATERIVQRVFKNDL